MATLFINSDKKVTNYCNITNILCINGGEIPLTTFSGRFYEDNFLKLLIGHSLY